MIAAEPNRPEPEGLLPPGCLSAWPVMMVPQKRVGPGRPVAPLLRRQADVSRWLSAWQDFRCVQELAHRWPVVSDLTQGCYCPLRLHCLEPPLGGHCRRVAAGERLWSVWQLFRLRLRLLRVEGWLQRQTGAR